MSFSPALFVIFFLWEIRILQPSFILIISAASIYWTQESTSWQIIFGFCIDRSASYFIFHYHLQRVDSTESPHAHLLIVVNVW